MDGILIVYCIKRQKMGLVFECNFFLHLLEEKTMADLSLSLSRLRMNKYCLTSRPILQFDVQLKQIASSSSKSHNFPLIHA